MLIRLVGYIERDSCSGYLLDGTEIKDIILMLERIRESREYLNVKIAFVR